MKCLSLCFLVLLVATSKCLADDDISEEKNVALEDSPDDEPFKGVGEWFKSVADEAKDNSESGLDTLKDWTEDIKEKSDSGLGSLKDWAGGLEDRFGKAKEKIEEAGEKMKESVGDAALNVQEEVESAASKISKHAKEASDTFMKMFRF